MRLNDETEPEPQTPVDVQPYALTHVRPFCSILLASRFLARVGASTGLPVVGSLLTVSSGA